MNESRLCTIELIEQFLSADTLVAFSKQGDDTERYEHISRVLKRFDYPSAINANAVCCCATCDTRSATAARKSLDWFPNGARTAWQLCHLPSTTGRLPPRLRANTCLLPPLQF